LDRFNQAYFDRLRSRIIEAGNRGIYVSIMLFDGWSIESKNENHHPWIGHPFNGSNNINGIDGDVNADGQGTETHTLQNATVTAYQEAYVDKVIDTVNDLNNVLYEISNEDFGSAENTAWQYHMIDYIKQYEATKSKQHPVGMTVQWPGDDGDLYASHAEWISPNGAPVADGSKVILFDTDHLGGQGDRQWVWKSFARGLDPIYMDSYDGQANGRGATDPTQNDIDVRANMGYVLSFANRMNLEDMTPRPDLCSSEYCLANPSSSGAEYLVYLPSGGSVVVDLSETLGTLKVEWFNPEDGIILDDGVTAGGSEKSFASPFSSDTVLYLYGGTITPPTSTPKPNPNATPTPSFSPTPDLRRRFFLPFVCYLETGWGFGLTSLFANFA
jgi:hypothetical protein